MQKGKTKQYRTYLPQMVYALLLLIVVVVPYVLRDRLSWPWIAWTILGVCIVGVLATYARAIYHGFIEP
ncbi:MAG: hypothetical protein HXS46_12195 [Theionarchaea archaeon]|nr:MAG: hypothetical protein AYK18_16780 [Theionarchaea archaeon DG-70]MBU7011441.1 hypothetical protein [Theionarchaea archaeon]